MLILLLFTLTLITNPLYCEHYPDWFLKVFFMEYEHGITYHEMMSDIYYLESIHSVYTYQANYHC